MKAYPDDDDDDDGSGSEKPRPPRPAAPSPGGDDASDGVPPPAADVPSTTLEKRVVSPSPARGRRVLAASIDDFDVVIPDYLANSTACDDEASADCAADDDDGEDATAEDEATKESSVDRAADEDRHPTNTAAPLGSYFEFDQADWRAVFGSEIEDVGGTFAAIQRRGNEVVYAGDVMVWPANSTNIAPHPPIGRRDPSSGGSHFEDGDELEPPTGSLGLF